MTVKVGDELPTFTRETGFANWNRYAAVNDEFVPIHMDDAAGEAAGNGGAFGMGNLQWAYLHNMLRSWVGEKNAGIKEIDLSSHFSNHVNNLKLARLRGSATRGRQKLHSRIK